MTVFFTRCGTTPGNWSRAKTARQTSSELHAIYPTISQSHHSTEFGFIMQNTQSSPTQSRKNSIVVTGKLQRLLRWELSNLFFVGAPKFDLESYIQNYRGTALAIPPVYMDSTDTSSGRTRLERLLLIGTYSQFLGVDALKAAVNEAKHGKDIKRYLDAQISLETIAPQEPEARRDLAWMEKQEKENQVQAASLEKQLKEYKNNLVKESIRVCWSIHFNWISIYMEIG
jgi:hypothetical protein